MNYWRQILRLQKPKRQLNWEIFSLSDDVVCLYCKDAHASGDFATGKRWDDWKIDYLKRHVTQKSHLDSVSTLRLQKTGGLPRLLNESADDRAARKENSLRKSADIEEVKILIDNVLLAISMNISMLSVQDLHDHMSKYVSLPNSWRSKNYAFEFVECINDHVQQEILTEIRSANYHTLIIDESTDISVTKMLILYLKFRPSNDINYRTVFAGIVKLTACDSKAIVDAIKKFYSDHDIDMLKMVMFTSDGASVMLGKQNGVAAKLRHDIPHLFQQHCVAHREDLAIDDACKHVQLMKDIETLLRTVYTLFSRSSVKQAEFTQLAEVLDSDAVSFRPLKEVRWLSRHFALTAFIRNIQVLLEYCRKRVDECNDPVCKYCVKQLSNPQIRIALLVINDVVCKLAELNRLLQRSNLTPIEAFQFVKARIAKLRAQYLKENICWSDEVTVLLNSNQDVDVSGILRFVERVCLHMENRFPDTELMDWKIFELSVLGTTADFDSGRAEIEKLAAKYYRLFPDLHDVTELSTQLMSQYREFRFLVCEK